MQIFGKACEPCQPPHPPPAPPFPPAPAPLPPAFPGLPVESMSAVVVSAQVWYVCSGCWCRRLVTLHLSPLTPKVLSVRDQGHVGLGQRLMCPLHSDGAMKPWSKSGDLLACARLLVHSGNALPSPEFGPSRSCECTGRAWHVVALQREKQLFC